MNNCSDRACIVVTREVGESNSTDCNDSGSVCFGSAAVYNVVSSVIRSMSHFRRWELRGSDIEETGGCRFEKADRRRD